jgi:hypothetical protein
MQTHLDFQIVLAGSILVVLTLSTVTTIVMTHLQSVLATTARPANQTDIHATAESSNMTFVGNMAGGKSMMMPGGNMTFGASLQNAKMHLLEAMMDLTIGNTKGAMAELNLTDQSIKIHEQEIKSMMMEVKGMMGQMKGNTTSSSMVSKNATS